MNPILLENECLRLQFNAQNGALTGLTAVETGWKILNRPELGLSFRLLVPLRPDRDWHSPQPRNNPVYGEKQELAGVEVSPKGQWARFQWGQLVSEMGGTLPIDIRLEVRLVGRKVVFSMDVDNHSEYVVENIYCPYLGDLTHPHGAEWFRSFFANYGRQNEYSIWPTFHNTRGYYGIDFPTQLGGPSDCGAPMSPYILLRSQQEGLFVGVNEPSSELLAWQVELRPGYASAMQGDVPQEAAIRFAAVHVPYILPGEKRNLTPVAIQAYHGDWQQGVEIYKHWRSAWMSLPAMPAWASEPHAWQQIHINSPEDELRLPFRELVRVGEECARHGVKVIQLVGWNDGGQDQGNPSHDPDPRLGTFAELKQAIASIQVLGVKVVLFSKFTWADQATDDFRRDLIRQAVKNPYGDYYVYPGYQYQTATQLLDINTKRLVPMCFLSEAYLQRCEKEFQKILDLGADGILFDECQHHGPALLCFDESHGHRRGAPVYANDRHLIQRFSKMAAGRNTEFLFAGEACYDWEMEAYHLAYFRSEGITHLPLSRFMLPAGQFMTAVTGFNDRHMINQCLLYRYIISYEPFNFKGHLDDFPQTVAYGRQMDALRTAMREYLWDGEFEHEVGAEVTVSGKPHHPCAVFRSKLTGRAAVVVANYDDHSSVRVQVRLTSDQPLSRYRLVDDPTWKVIDNDVLLPPKSAAVVI